MPKNENSIFTRLIACDLMLTQPEQNLAACQKEMTRLKISAAVVRNRDCLETAPEFHNQRLLLAAASVKSIIPALFVSPDGVAPQYDVAEYLRTRVAAGVRLAWTTTVLQPYLLENPFCPYFGEKMFAALSRHRLPLLLTWPEISFKALHEVMREFPELRVILTGLTRQGRQPALETLLESHPELYICFSPLFSVHGGYASLCRRFGAQRFVWGSGYPEAEGGAALAGLLYAGLEQSELAQVAHQNIERLLTEVRL